MVFGPSGVDVVREESRLPRDVQTRIQERRRHRPLWYASQGAAVGFSFGYVGNVAAQGLSAEWLSPSTMMAVGTMIFACGQLWGARTDDRRRIAKLEENSVTKETFSTLAESCERMEVKLDRLIERPR